MNQLQTSSKVVKILICGGRHNAPRGGFDERKVIYRLFLLPQGLLCHYPDWGRKQIWLASFCGIHILFIGYQ